MIKRFRQASREDAQAVFSGHRTGCLVTGHSRRRDLERACDARRVVRDVGGVGVGQATIQRRATRRSLFLAGQRRARGGCRFRASGKAADHGDQVGRDIRSGVNRRRTQMDFVRRRRRLGGGF